MTVYMCVFVHTRYVCACQSFLNFFCSCNKKYALHYTLMDDGIVETTHHIIQGNSFPVDGMYVSEFHLNGIHCHTHLTVWR